MTSEGSGEAPRTRLAARRVARDRARQRLRLATVAVLLLSTVVLVATAVIRTTGADPAAPRDGLAAGEGVSRPVPEASGTAAPAGGDWPAEGPGTWRYAGGGAVLGADGEVARFQVAVEDGLEIPADDLAAEVDAILGDPRGWTAGGEHRFQRVGDDEEADFAIRLATPGTSEELCAEGGFHTGGVASCRLAAEVILNVARWLDGAPGYDAPLVEYRAYAVNHLIGLELGYGAQACAAPGQPAPVMLPPNLDRRGCTPNGWPYLDGSRHTGPALP